MDGEALLRSLIEDRRDQCEEQYRMTGTAFLDLHERSVAEAILRETAGSVSYRFYGGFPEAERTLAVFFPEYAAVPDGADGVRQYFAEHPEEELLTVVRAQVPRGGKTLTHRDYLGSLLGLGLKRNTIGDILVRPDGADVIVLREIGEFLLYHYEKAGRTSLALTLCPMTELKQPEQRTESLSDTVASLRLDSLAASAFSTSRAKAAEAIRAGLVLVNHAEILKVDRILQEGDQIVWRRKGKVQLEKIGGMSRKDRIFVVFKKYV